ncbi:MAG: exodeoxyribonuclease VII large subunit [Lachnospiraceae bacterium]|nr:exodeoxyribonuclease VII large subunit [Lachnospiraceae bacterium]
MQQRIYSVSVVNRYVKQLLQQDMLLSALWVSGEISNFKRHSSGHLYFTLKDAEGSMAAVMFVGEARLLEFWPQNGQQVQVQGYVSLYEKTGQYQLYVKKMQPQGNGALYEAFERLKAKLEAEGLFDSAYKKPIPAFPRGIGIVTSPTGAAIRDIVQIARRRHPGIRLVLYPALVQGEGAAATIVKGIQTLDRMAEIDTLIVGRGGGSIEDLWPFNEEMVARAIAEAKTPVISAVGHETDFTIADFAADMRAPTPSAAAELAVPEIAGIMRSIGLEEQKQGALLKKKLWMQRQRLELWWQRLQLQDPGRQLDSYRQRLDMAMQYQQNRIEQQLKEKKQQLEALENALMLLSPQHQLEKGYALLTDEAGKAILRAEQIQIADRVNIQMQDGRLTVKVEQKELASKGRKA